MGWKWTWRCDTEAKNSGFFPRAHRRQLAILCNPYPSNALVPTGTVHTWSLDIHIWLNKIKKWKTMKVTGVSDKLWVTTKQHVRKWNSCVFALDCIFFFFYIFVLWYSIPSALNFWEEVPVTCAFCREYVFWTNIWLWDQWKITKYMLTAEVSRGSRYFPNLSAFPEIFRMPCSRKHHSHRLVEQRWPQHWQN